METTPARRVTRSQAKNPIPFSSAAKSRTTNLKSQQQERSVLIDITNDSPIVGLASGTPSSALAKQRSIRAKDMVMTPGSGEALLRGQVKTLLQKVEEEAQLSKLLPLEKGPFLDLQNLVRSPAGLLNPTPANTPQVGDLSADALVVASPVVEEQMNIAQMMNQASIIGRSLFLDFSDKSERSSSTVTEEGVVSVSTEEEESSCSVVKSEEDDSCCSVWSIQGNPGTEEGEGSSYGGEEIDVDELCEGLRKMSVVAKFEGKHKRFVYNSDGEMEGAEEEDDDDDDVLRLKGLPTPKGKHLRFPQQEDDC